MADVVYNKGLEVLADGSLDPESADLWGLLVTNAYAPNPDTHEFRAAITSEVTGTGYTAGGMDLGVITLTRDDANNRILLSCADPVWDPATITARALVVYKKVGTAATDPLIVYLDFGADVSSTDAAFTVNMDAAGFLAIGA